MEIPRREVVVGDVVILETGDEVPADGRLLAATDLQVDESSLTGEPITEKHLATSAAPATENGEAYAKDLLLRSSMVMSGTGRMVVTAVGDETEIGHVARKATELTAIKTPLNQQLDRLAKLISKIGSGVSIVAFLAFLIHDILTQPLWHTTDYVGMAEVVLRYFMMAVTLIVMAVPEGTAHGRDAGLGAQHAAHAEVEQPGAQAAGLGNDGRRDRDLYRQDGHADAEPHERDELTLPNEPAAEHWPTGHGPELHRRARWRRQGHRQPHRGGPAQLAATARSQLPTAAPVGRDYGPRAVLYREEIHEDHGRGRRPDLHVSEGCARDCAGHVPTDRRRARGRT